MTFRQQVISWSTLMFGLLVLLASGYVAYRIGVRLALEMQALGWWQAVIAFSPVQFIPRCLAVDADCRNVFGSAFLERYGVGQYVFIFALMLSIAGVVLVIPKPSKPYTARFATLGDVSSLLLTPKEPYGVPLLNFRGKTLGVRYNPKRGEALKHILLTAPSQTGKSVHAKSVLGSFKGSTILVDIKGELFRDTSGYRSDLGRLFVLHPRGTGHRYDPLLDIGHDMAALKSAAELLITDTRDSDPIFAQRAVPAIAAALKAAQLEGEAAIPYLYDIITEGPVHFIHKLTGFRDDDVRKNLIIYLGTRPEEFDLESLNDPRGFIASSWGTMLTRLEPFFAPGIRQLMGGSDFRAKDIAAEVTNLYLTWPEELVRSNSRPLSLIMHALVTGLCRDADEGGFKVPTLMLLDEAPSYRIPSLATYLATMLGRGIAAMVIVQSHAQLKSSYRDEADTIVENCAARLYFAPAHNTAKRLSEEFGYKSVQVQSLQRSDNRISDHHFKRELMTPDEVARLPQNEAILMLRGHHPIRGKRILWYKNPILVKRLRREAPQIQGWNQNTP